MPILSKTLSVFAPAKINLHLAVKDRRQDGFHNIESVFLAVNFGDTLYFKVLRGENTVKIDIKGLKLPLLTGENIIFKAVSLFREKTGFNKGLKIRVKKRIPLGGGLGGGSSDAAAALLTLNKIAGFPCSREVLLEMAACLGSDVPFFIHETAAARVTGRGERILPIAAPKLFLVLVNPGFPSDTAAAFRLLDADVRAPAYESVLPERLTNTPKDWSFWNDFLPIFEEPEKSVYGDILSQLWYSGAQYANLSGSGATCFGVFADEKRAKKAARSLQGKWAFVQECCTWISPVKKFNTHGTMYA
jgi:4-diphosphocytidyl-2-C-methyl-D-erythritol kinase